MTTIKESAQAYEPKHTKNVAELEKVDVNLEIMEEVRQDKDGKDFTIKFIVVDESEYRVPDSVLGNLKALMAKKPELKYFSVLKQGEGIGTTYQVIPME